MASATKYSGGYRVQFKAPDGKRHTWRLVKGSQRAANDFKMRIEQLLIAAELGQRPDAGMREWLASCSAAVRERLARMGVVEQERVETLAAFVDGYIALRLDVKAATAITFGNVRRNLVEKFGEGKRLRDITSGDSDEFRTWLRTHEGLAENTIKKRCSIAKQFFRAAERKKLIDENPFKDMKGIGTQRNTTRQHFITREDADKVLAACPDSEWRLIVALSRFGGLRCPSEHLRLRWSDVQWERQRFIVHSPKTEHHEGKATREVPISRNCGRTWKRCRRNGATVNT